MSTIVVAGFVCCRLVLRGELRESITKWIAIVVVVIIVVVVVVVFFFAAADSSRVDDASADVRLVTFAAALRHCATTTLL